MIKNYCIIFFMLILLCGCSSVSSQYLRADRATFDVVAPRYLKYVENDEKLSDLKKGIASDVIKMWKARIVSAGMP